MKIPDYSNITEAADRIAPYANKTPVLTSESANIKSEAKLFFKCENFQKVGAFKFRGACNAIFSLSDKDASKGVATHSSGNHAQALALSAKLRNVPAFVVMPRNAPPVKIAAVKGYGAKVILCEPTQAARESTLEQVVKETGSTFIHPYDNDDVIAGQGTAAVELLSNVPDLDMIITPVGGGGLLSGTSIAAKHINPNIQVIGAEPELADDAYRSFKSGKRIPLNGTDTVADGLRTSLSERTFSIIHQNVDDIVTVSESSIIRDMQWIWERMNMIIETSCAVPVSVVFDEKLDVKGKKVGIIITGGNVDLAKLPWQSEYVCID
ncbi:MAG: pyridoxal-phosphate dependent enzyme [Balneolaceae bacterium]